MIAATCNTENEKESTQHPTTKIPDDDSEDDDVDGYGIGRTQRKADVNGITANDDESRGCFLYIV